MKHGSLRVFCLILMACITVASGFSDEFTSSLETIVLETFDNGSEAGYDWKVEGSKFATKTDEATYPKSAFVAAWPSQLFKSKDGKDKDGNTLNALGIQGAFDRRGDNWIDIYPTLKEDDANSGAAAGDPFEIPMPGRTDKISMWVWGMNLDYYLEVYVRDYLGLVHVLKMGDLDFAGWNKLVAKVPSTIRQNKKSYPRLESLKLVKFRIWTKPREQVSPFYVYFDQLATLTDTFESIFDGDDLADPDTVQELWNGGGQ
ncbi:MAG: flagellar filament outer layer protein FlaA [Treponema sp.]|nr:flagellar filament outer layer protein FlaA [Treponema sp.]